MRDIDCSDAEGGDERNEAYNRKRAAIRDASHRPQKNFQREDRKMNPASNTISYFQIIGTGMDTHDTSPSVLLFFDNKRFLFNAGEGLQRFCCEHKIKLSKIDHIFLSRVCSETAGGLPGLLLTLAGMGDGRICMGEERKIKPKVNVLGPPGLTELVTAMKSFIPNDALDDHPFNLAPGSEKLDEPLLLIDDEVVKISAILLRPSHVKVSELIDEKNYHESENATQPRDISVIYICELPEIKGKLDPEKAIALGLRPGPKYGKLQRGDSVESDDKKIMVHPSDVMGPSVPGPMVLLVDCPTLMHLQYLLSLQCLTPYHNNTVCIIHLTPTHITKTDSYQTWLSKFGAARHIMTGHEMKNIEVPILKSSARIATCLDYLCPQFFPSSGFLSSKDEIPSTSTSQVIPAENLLKFNLRPGASFGIDTSAIPNFSSPSEIINELELEIPDIAEASKQIAKLWLEEDETIPEELKDISREDMEIVLLGTGSSQPSKYRNVSSIYINLFSKGSLLLDCGEGTLGQLKRRFGIEGGDEALRSLKFIWISHIHADHHAGLARILALRCDLLKGVPHEPILVIGPKQLKVFLDKYQELEDLDMQFLDCGHTTGKSLIDNADIPIVMKLKNILTEAGLEALVSFYVVHCAEAFGVVLKAANRMDRLGKTISGWKIVYSGDTLPCIKDVTACKNATVLIHEATFEESMSNEAAAKKHSTTKQAIQAGIDTGAHRIILTHFSQRYPKIPVLNDKQKNFDKESKKKNEKQIQLDEEQKECEKAFKERTCIAFDLMSVNLADIHVLPKLLPYLKLLFKDKYGDDDHHHHTRL